MLRHWLRAALVLVAACGVVPLAHAQSEDDLLPVEQAFKLTVKLAEPGKIALHWDIAPDYYLYRTRIKAKTSQAGATLGDLDAAGRNQEARRVPRRRRGLSQGDRRDACRTRSTDASTQSLAVTITVQGCHEVDPKICYPPHPTTVTLDLPSRAVVGAASAAISAPTDDAAAGKIAAEAAPTTAASDAPLSLASKLGVAANTEPLPPEQAFVFEAIASSPTGLLARWTMPKGYYLYRDKSSVTLADGAGVTLGAPAWPKGVDHTDEHFGTVQVYFDQVELPIALKRENGAAQTIRLDAEYQGCQDDGICYPVMTKTVAIEMPAANAARACGGEGFVRAGGGEPRPPSPGLPAGLSRKRERRVARASDQSEEQALASNLSSNRWLALFSFFGFGLLLAFTPCVFPMIPILSGIIAGSGENISTRRAFVLSVVYVLATCRRVHDRRDRRRARRRESAGRVPEAVDSLELRDPVRAARRSACSASTNCSCRRARGRRRSRTSATSRKAAR